MEIMFYSDETDHYQSINFIMRREWETKTPNGNSMHGRWVLRNRLDNQLVDFDKYRNDLAERNNLNLNG